jgi:hypothetical protein
MNKFSKDSWSLGHDFNPGPSEYKIGELATLQMFGLLVGEVKAGHVYCCNACSLKLT